MLLFNVDVSINHELFQTISKQRNKYFRIPFSPELVVVVISTLSILLRSVRRHPAWFFYFLRRCWRKYSSSLCLSTGTLILHTAKNIIFLVIESPQVFGFQSWFQVKKQLLWLRRKSKTTIFSLLKTCCPSLSKGREHILNWFIYSINIFRNQGANYSF